MTRVVVLFSGGLDSMLAARIMRRQAIETLALNVNATFDSSQVKAKQAADELGLALTVRSVEDDYFQMIRNPRYGYGKAVNPCVDCHLYMCRLAARFMKETDACAVATGEVLGQRPMSQKRGDLELIERRAGLEGRLLRPLSAKLLDPTLPEQEGLVDREALYGFSGRGRRELIELAMQLGIERTPTPSPGCSLTDKIFAGRVRDLMQFDLNATRWDFELLKTGRHFRFTEQTKLVVGRDADENARLCSHFQQADRCEAALLHPENFLGPDVLVTGQVTDEAVRFAGSLIVRYSRRADPNDAQVRVTRDGKDHIFQAFWDSAAQAAVPV